MSKHPIKISWHRLFFIAYLALQIAIPTIQSLRPRPSKFSWQMFSGTSVPTQVKLRTGETIHAFTAQELTSMVGNWRGDLSLDKYLPPYLCNRFPGTDAVLLYNIESDDPKEFPCND